jgi:hypothetical protein
MSPEEDEGAALGAATPLSPGGGGGGGGGGAPAAAEEGVVPVCICLRASRASIPEGFHVTPDE